MVAKMTVPNSIKRALNYNEQKVQQDKAECLYANGFLKEADKMTFHEKLEHFEHRNALNQRSETKTLHISLNFDPSEKLAKEQLIKIASTYMEKIGFGEQPYIVYKHNDAGHPHIHIVTTTIKDDGKRISLHNIGRNQSTKARKEIEKMFGLVKAEEKRNKQDQLTTTTSVQKVHYGKSETKRAITNVLDKVLQEYKFSSLAELNAILGLYNIRAERGMPGSVMHEKGGLYYRILDERGKPTGVPVKASSIHSNPTLAYLQQIFKANEGLKQANKKTVKAKIDWVLRQPPKDLNGLVEALRKEKITPVIRRNEEGKVYGLTYIDHTTKTVFNGSDIGKEYSANAVQEKLSPTKEKTLAHSPTKSTVTKENGETHLHNTSPEKHLSVEQIRNIDLAEKLLQSKFTSNHVPYQFRRRKKKHKKQ